MSKLSLWPNSNSRRFFNDTIPVNASIASQTESDFIEVSGLMDDFISIEEYAPGSDWEEILAASWGVPYAIQPEISHAFAGIKESAVRSLRSVLHGVRSKKFETA